MPLEPIRANIPLPGEGLVSPGLAKAYREVLGELSRGVEDPGRDIALQPSESITTGITRMFKLYGLDLPGTFLKSGGEQTEAAYKGDPINLEDVTGLVAETTLWSMIGQKGGMLGMGGRRPAPGFYSSLQKGIRSLIKEGTGAKTTTVLPEFADTQSALRFGQNLSPKQVKLLEQRKTESLKRYNKFMDEDNLEGAMVEATKGQFDREAIEAKTILEQFPELKENLGLTPKPSRAVSLPGQTALNLLKKKGVSPAELEWTGVEKMLAGRTESIPLKNVMRQAIKEEIKVGEKKLLPFKEESLSSIEAKEYAMYSDSSYRKPFTVSEDIPYEETLLTLGRKGISPIEEMEFRRLRQLDSGVRSEQENIRFKSLQNAMLKADVRSAAYRDPSHYPDVENYIVHARSEIRPGARGEKVRMIQEVQESSWGIEGRKRGFGRAGDRERFIMVTKQQDALILERMKLRDKFNGLKDRTTPEAESLKTRYENLSPKIEQLEEERLLLKVQVPPTPFKEDALKLMLKKELYEAAKDPTVTHLGWTTPEQQMVRWPAEVAEKKLRLIYGEKFPAFFDAHLKRLAEGGPVGTPATPERIQQIVDMHKAGLITKGEAKRMKSGIVGESKLVQKLPMEELVEIEKTITANQKNLEWLKERRTAAKQEGRHLLPFDRKITEKINQLSDLKIKLRDLTKMQEGTPIPTIKLDDWIREKILKGQPISKIDQSVFRDALA